MFINVKHGADRSDIFNINCRNINLLAGIKLKCNCNPNDTIDLSDEVGSVVNLANHPYEYGTHFLAERGNFVLLKVEKDEYASEDQRPTYVPLLDGLETNKEFLEKLNPVSKSAKSRKKGQEDSFSPKGRNKGRQAALAVLSGVRRTSAAARPTPQIKRSSVA